MTVSGIRVAVIGLGNKGSQHVKVFRKMPGVRIVALCDADTAHLDKMGEMLAEHERRRVFR